MGAKVQQTLNFKLSSQTFMVVRYANLTLPLLIKFKVRCSMFKENHYLCTQNNVQDELKHFIFDL